MSDTIFKKIVLIILGFVVVVQAYLFFDFKNSKKSDAVDKSITENAANSEQPGVETNNLEAKSEAKLNITSTTDEETTALLKKVFNHIYLPSGDVRIETIIKVEELKKINPIFYEFAKNGDKLLIYKDRVILYDPVIDKALDILHLQK